jgi:DNA-binding beta-propeller fold protein YncE
LTAVLALGAVELAFGTGVDARNEQRGAKPAAPVFQVDPMWPKPMPNAWILGSITGVAVDAQDHIWIVHRGAPSLTARTENGLGTDPPTAELCCRPAPPVLEFDQAGTLVSSWGGPGQGYEWPTSPGGIAIDPKGNVWITAAGADPAAGRGGRAGGRAGGGGAAGGAAAGAPATPPPPPATPDTHILKFSRKGEFQMAIGKPGQAGASDSTTLLNRPANLDFDATGSEVYVADGYVNRRVIVFDAATGAYKRHWGAYGAAPGDNPGAYDAAAPPAKQFRTVTCASVAKDGTVYVCDRNSNRIQVFTKDGKFVKEAVIAPATLASGAVWDIAFSPDPQQQLLYVADGQNQRVRVLVRDTLEVLTQVGTGGRYPGQFYSVAAVAVDSRGNLYTGEGLEGKRLQKWNVKR